MEAQTWGTLRTRPGIPGVLTPFSVPTGHTRGHTVLYVLGHTVVYVLGHPVVYVLGHTVV